MARIATVFVLLAGVPFCWQPLWGQTPGVRKDIAKNPKQNSKLAAPQPQIGTEATPLIVETHTRAESKEEAAEAKADKDQTDFVNRWTLRFAGIAALATMFLVWIGWRGVRAANRTLKAIEHQGSLMEVQFKQWVILDNWRIAKPRGGKMQITVDLINPTEFPMTLSEDYMDYVEVGDLKRHTKYVIGENVFMSPHSPTTIEIEIELTDEEEASFGMSLPVSARLSHSHQITKQKVIQRVIGGLDCVYWKSDAKWHATFTTFFHMNPEIQGH